jgi:5-methylcytosine-specific restriction endonuclease McrA
MMRHGKPVSKRTKDGECRYCGGAVVKPRRTFCSQKCVDEYMIRTSASYARRLVLKRDKGICAECGIDCVALRKKLLARIKKHQREDYVNGYQRSRRLLERLGISIKRNTLWDADHILPVEHGGGMCGLDNLQTLCWRCHAKKTKKAAQDRFSKKA